ncbi:S8 family serine peptidase, partial [Arachnia propionica]|uniref:S8 family serine peptidase n=1 Tax=Arachnia propionica TaxID=1750 RepID=UPI00163AA9D5
MDQSQTVMVLLKEQPDSPDPALSGLVAVERVLSRWQDVEGFTVRRKFAHLVTGFSATVPGNQLIALSNDPDVASVQKVKEYQPFMQTAAQMTQSLSARSNLGVDGAGTVISIIDSGIDPSHQDMRLDDGVEKKLTPQGDLATDKIPYGWNYADDNANFVDTTSSMHGMHVAGIAAANGGKDADAITNGRINGIAPNAQLLAMKVFSNDPALSGGAMDDDIIAAIEDSVKLGADVINMSLGISNGTNQDSIGLGRAIALAHQAGVQVVVAAGNEALNGSFAYNDVDQTDMLDDGTLGTPASAPNALAVASVDNSHMLATAATVVGGGTTLELPYRLQIGQVDDQTHGIVSAGLGRPEDFPANTEGNYVLIERGEVAPRDMFNSAVEAGALGVLTFNSAEGGEVFRPMGGLELITMPGILLFRSSGEQIRQAIEAGGGIAQITLSKELKTLPLTEQATPS